MPKKRVPFDMAKAMQAAWDLCWQRNLDQRAEGFDYGGRTYFLTATDIERQVRCFAQDSLDGEPWGTCCYPDSVRLPGGTFENIRRWLLRHPQLDSHNFGKGHISGERFRPRGAPLSPGEQKHFEQDAKQRANPKPKPVHYGRWGGHPLCTKDRISRYSYRRSTARTSLEQDKVTCKACLKKLKTMAPVPAPVDSSDE